MKKILFTDLDGTLLSTDKTVSAGNREAIASLLAAGNYFVIATGRPVKSGFDVAKSLGLTKPGCYMVAVNGGALFDCASGQILEQKTLPFSSVRYLFEEARRADVYIQTYQGAYLLTEQDKPELHSYVRQSTMKAQVVPDVFEVLTEEPHKVLLSSLTDEESLIRFQQEHLAWEQGKCNSFFSNREYLEYCPLGVDKGSGIRRMAELLKVPIENTWAVGDERNDIPMLEAAGTGVAVANGYPDAKEAADYVTTRDNDHDGVAEVIRHFGLNRG